MCNLRKHQRTQIPPDILLNNQVYFSKCHAQKTQKRLKKNYHLKCQILFAIYSDHNYISASVVFPAFIAYFLSSGFQCLYISGSPSFKQEDFSQLPFILLIQSELNRSLDLLKTFHSGIFLYCSSEWDSVFKFQIFSSLGFVLLYFFTKVHP